jgi:hypothetical protein
MEYEDYMEKDIVTATSMKDNEIKRLQKKILCLENTLALRDLKISRLQERVKLLEEIFINEG